MTHAKAAELVPPAAATYKPMLLRAAHTTWGLDAPVAVLAAQVHQESGWRPNAVSTVGALGLAQFMPATARWWCGVDKASTSATAPADCSPTNPTWALRALVGYDRWLYDRLAAAGPEPDRMWATLRAYNGGLGHWLAERGHAVGPGRAAVDAACGTAKRSPQFCPESLGYPRRIMVALQPRYSAWGRAVVVTP
jgi:soluble lytic murein transglycosylase-like protein